MSAITVSHQHTICHGVHQDITHFTLACYLNISLCQYISVCGVRDYVDPLSKDGRSNVAASSVLHCTFHRGNIIII